MKKAKGKKARSMPASLMEKSHNTVIKLDQTMDDIAVEEQSSGLPVLQRFSVAKTKTAQFERNQQDDSDMVRPTLSPNYIGPLRPDGGANQTQRLSGGPVRERFNKQMQDKTTLKFNKPVQTWDRKQLFDDFDSPEVYPILKFMDVFKKATLTKDHELNFTGVEQLTDLTFTLLLDQLGTVTLCQQVVAVDLSGCKHITDQGVLWMLKAFPKLKKVHLNGCKKITSRVLYYISEYQPTVKTVEARATGISLVPHNMDVKHFETAMLDGCPLVSSKGKEPLTTFRVCICVFGSRTTTDLLSYLTGRVVSPESSKPFSYSSVTLKDNSVCNIIQCPESNFTDPWMLAERSVYILHCDAFREETARVTSSLTQTIIHITALVELPVFVLVGGSDKSISTGILDNIKLVRTRLKKDLDLIKQDSNLAATTFQKQQELSRMRRLFENLDSTKDRLNLLDIDTSKPADKEKLLILLAELRNTGLNKTFPEFSKLTSESLTALTNLPKLLPQGIVSMDTAVKSIQSGSWPKTLSSRPQIESLLDLANITGTIVKVTSLTSGDYILKPDWLMDVANDISALKADSEISGPEGLTTTTIEKAKASLTKSSLNLEDPSTREVLKGLGFGVVFETSLSLLNYLPLEPQTPIDYFWGPVKKDKDLEATYQFVFPHTVTDTVISTLLNEVLSFYPSAVKVTWRNGIFLEDSLVDIFIERKTENSGTHSLLLKGRIFKPEEIYKITTGQAIEILWQSLEQWKLIVDGVISLLQLSATVQCLSDTTKPDSVKRLVSGHMMKWTNGKTRCETCLMSPPAANFLWNVNRQLYPSFSDSDVQLSDPAPFDIEGSLWRGKSKGKVTKRLQWNPQEDSSIKITVLKGIKADMDAFSIILASTIDNEGFVMSFSAGKLSIKGKSVKLPKTAELKAGDSLMFRVMDSVSAEGSHFTVNILLNEEIIHSLQLTSWTFFWTFAINRDVVSDEMLLMVELPVGLGYSGGNKLLSGMRLEARDRKNPLICVATIEKIVDDGQILIHFDGWTDRFDYWTEQSSPDLHPLGYQEHIGHTHTDWRAELQPPKGYSKAFDWGAYLKEIDAPPVPHGFFSPAQTEGTPPDEEIKALQTSAVGSNRMSAMFTCQFVKNRSLYIEQKVLSFLNDPKALKSLHALSTFSTVKKYLCLLPAEFNLQMLDFPVRRLVTDLTKQNTHFLCSGNELESLHFVDSPGHAFTYQKEYIHPLSFIIRYATLVLLNQESFLPDQSVKFCTGIEVYSTEQAERKLLKVFKQYLRMFELYYPWEAFYLRSTDYSILSTGNNMTDTHFKSAVNSKLNSLQDVFAVPVDSQPLQCKTHQLSHNKNQGIGEIPIENFRGYTKLINKLDFHGNKLVSLPQGLAEQLIYLSHLDVSNNSITELPAGLFNLTGLDTLNISSNKIKILSPSLENLANSLTYLNISHNPLGKLPPCFPKLVHLVVLKADNVGEINKLEGIENLTKLKVLSLGYNLMTQPIPDSFGKLELTELSMPGIPWFTGYDSPKSTLSFEAFSEFLDKNMILASLEKQKLFGQVDKDGKGHLSFKEVAELNNILFMKYPRFGDMTQAPTKKNKSCEGGFPEVLLSLTKLTKLDLSFHRLQAIPPALGTSMSTLSNLRLSDNPVLETLCAEAGGLPLKELHLKGCGQLKTPPKEIINRGFAAVFGYLKRLQTGSVSCRRTKLMVVGLGGAGKTSLIRALTHRRFMDGMDVEDMYELMGENITDGIDITTWQVNVNGSEKPLEYSVWDFAGQTVYYNTHQFFLSTRAVYLLLWNIRLGYEHAGLEFWLSSIACHAPGAPVFVVATHCDKVEKTKLPTDDLQRRFPQIRGFHSVSSFSLMGIPDLQNNLIELTLQEKYMGEQIPQVWLNMEQKVKEKTKMDVELLPLKEVEDIAHQCGVFDQEELIQAVQFLHDLGSVQFFNTEFLRSYVVINPQWIVDVMTCVVSVHEGAIKEGKFAHKDMKTVWSVYPEEMHTWLLRLTEEFDLTFPLDHEKANLVPCLLPDKEPKFTWPELDTSKGHRETKMAYLFRYLPAGLFNRVQVRLHQFSDDAVIWKKGSLLKKNSHTALIRQVGVDEMLIKVQGPRPQNILYLVHEVLECLISESFYGVQYDFSIPCHDCLDMLSLDPCMFNSSKVQRAVELTVPFLQCDRYFHTQSVKELQATMPSTASSDLDLHLGKSIQELNDLHSDLVLKVFFSFSKDNVPAFIGDDKTVHPDSIVADLRKAGMKVMCTEPGEEDDISKLTMVLKESDIVVIGMSDEYVNNKSCTDLLIFARDTLRKTVILVILGTGFKWQKSHVGIVCANDVYVNMQKPDTYSTKMKELITSLKQRTEKNKVKDYPSCFISYCWSNSQTVVEQGGREKERAIGFGDPRKVKEHLVKNDISCWLDVEQVGKAGLYADIAEGLRRAKVVVAFVSDEYAESKNCQMEFRYAVTTLKIPTILVVVGTGYKWERTEVGMLSVGYECPKVNFQYENPSALSDILDEVKKLLPTQDDHQGKQLLKDEQQIAFQEELELAQRKFFRYICSFADSMDCEPYPRLIVLDLLPKTQDARENLNDGKPSTEQTEKEENHTASKYCFTLLCEHEEGWHDVYPSIPVPQLGTHEENVLLQSSAGYMARQMAILKNTNLTLNCMTSKDGINLYERFEQECKQKTSSNDLQEGYIEVRRVVMEMDQEGIMGNLKRCHLTNGKTAWLCPKHQKDSNVDGKENNQQNDKPIQPLDESSANQNLIQKDVLAEDSVRQPQLRALQRQEMANKGDKPKRELKRTTSRACSLM